MTKTKLASAAEISETKALKVKVNGQSILVAKVGDRTCAIVNKCPHLGLPIASGKLEDGIITCPFHGAKFDMATGKNVKWVSSVMGITLPEMGQKIMSMGKEATDIPCFAVTQEGEDLFVDA